MKFVLLAWLLFAINLPAASKTKKPPPVPEAAEGVRLDLDVAYLGEDRKEKADLYLPKQLPAGTKCPAVIIIHGGGFNDGDKAHRREQSMANDLVHAGYAAMSINYKLRKVEGQVTWPQCLHDVKTAVRWLRANAERLQINPDRIGVLGGSAGGNLAMMLALTQPSDGLEPGAPLADVSSAVQCAIDFYGAVDLMTYHDVKMFAKTREEAPELYKKASPTSYARKGAPPILIVHGTADKVVKVEQSQLLADALKKAGADYQLEIIPDAPHSFDLQPREKDLRPLVLGFLDKQLKK